MIKTCPAIGVGTDQDQRRPDTTEKYQVIEDRGSEFIIEIIEEG